MEPEYLVIYWDGEARVEASFKRRAKAEKRYHSLCNHFERIQNENATVVLWQWNEQLRANETISNWTLETGSIKFEPTEERCMCGGH